MSIRAPSLPTGLLDPDDVLRWSAETFGPRVALLSALGPQTCVLIERLAELYLPIRVVLLDTGLLFEETLALAERLEARYGVRVERRRPRLSLEAQAERHGSDLWLRDPDRCCALRKVAPLRDALADLDAWITGLRRDQSDQRSATDTVAWDPVHGRLKISPLAHWTRERVFARLRERDIPYNPLLDHGYASVGCTPCTRPIPAGAAERAGRWADHPEKTECGLHFPLHVTEST